MSNLNSSPIKTEINAIINNREATDFDAPLTVEISTLLCLQLRSVLNEHHQSLPCNKLELILYSGKQKSLTASSFGQFKNVFSESHSDAKEHFFVLESNRKEQPDSIESNDKHQTRSYLIKTEFGVVGELRCSSDIAKDRLIHCQNCTFKVAGILQRSINQEKARRWYRESHLWCGTSKHLQLIDLQIQRLASSSRPVLVSGLDNSERRTAAICFAVSGRTQKVPFIELEIDKKQRSVSEVDFLYAYRQASGGVLFVSCVANLTKDAWLMLCHLCQFPDRETLIVIGINESNQENNEKIDWLEYHCSSVHLPSFEARKQDIWFICQQYFLDNNISHTLTEPEIAMLQSQLTSFDELAAFIRHYADNLSVVTKLRQDSHSEIQKQINQFKQQQRRTSTQKNLVIPVGELYSSNISRALYPEEEHPAVLKALRYLASNFKDSFSLQDLAEQSFVSASHLSYLLKNRFGKSFKGLLIEFRIEKAQQLLIDSPMKQITQIAIDVGFSDLSHFEKTFKRHTTLTPRKFREQNRKKLSIDR